MFFDEIGSIAGEEFPGEFEESGDIVSKTCRRRRSFGQQRKPSETSATRNGKLFPKLSPANQLGLQKRGDEVLKKWNVFTDLDQNQNRQPRSRHDLNWKASE